MTPSQRILYLLSAASLALSALTLTAAPVTPQRRIDNTLRGNRLRTTGKAKDAILGIHRAPVLQYDTLRTPSREEIQVSGYDKPLRTNRETFLVTNSTARHIAGISITITYMDMQGRQLHARTDTLTADIPEGETRMIHLSTWDPQHSYYYHRGQQPRTANVTPYDILARINFILFSIDK